MKIGQIPLGPGDITLQALYEALKEKKYIEARDLSVPRFTI